MAQFDPNSKTADEVLKHLEKADGDERKRVLAAERGGKRRKTVLEALGVDPDERTDPTGRPMYPWEVDSENAADRNRVVEESDDQREAREAQLEQDAKVAAATPQGGVSPTGSGVAPAAQSAGGSTAPAGGSTAAGGTGLGGA